MAWNYLLRYSEPIRTKANESELYIELLNGCRIRLYGADNPDRLRGGYFNGIVLDEYADMRPSVWGEVIRPALADKQGWAVFIGTPKGRIGLYDIWAGKNQWADVEAYRLMLKASDTSILPQSELDDSRRTMTEDEYAQEYECSFDAAIKGAVYGKLIAEAEKRISGVPHDPATLVYTAWDLGIGDPSAIIWFQTVGKEVHILDYYETSGVDIAHYASVIKSKRYNYGGHILPHDAEPKELTSGKSVLDVLQGLGLDCTVLEASRVEDGINAARLLIPRCWFDSIKCERLLEALKLYHYEFDEKLNTFKNRPVHDWTSHGADAFRYLAMGIDSVAHNIMSGPIKFRPLGIY